MGHYKRDSIMSLLLLIILLLSFQWPVQNGTIHSTFGEPRPDHFHNGIDISSIDKKVYPVDAGKLVLVWDKALFPLEQYPGVGNYIIVAHNKKTYSLYAHMENNISIKGEYNPTDSLGLMGNTGRSYGTHLHFSILKEGKISANPLSLFPRIEDKKPPIVESVFIKVDDHYTTLREGSNIRLTKHRPLAIQCYDAIQKNERCGVYSLMVVFNNKTVANYTFDSISLDNKNRLTIKGLEFENLYDIKGNYIVNNITYNQGNNTVVIVAKDFAGNQTSKSINFNVVLDIR